MNQTQVGMNVLASRKLPDEAQSHQVKEPQSQVKAKMKAGKSHHFGRRVKAEPDLRLYCHYCFAFPAEQTTTATCARCHVAGALDLRPW